MTFRLHLTETKFTARYLVDPQALAPITKIMGRILRRKKTTWANTDARLDHNEFFQADLNQQISIRKLGGW